MQRFEKDRDGVGNALHSKYFRIDYLLSIGCFTVVIGAVVVEIGMTEGSIKMGSSEQTQQSTLHGNGTIRVRQKRIFNEM